MLSRYSYIYLSKALSSKLQAPSSKLLVIGLTNQRNNNSDNNSKQMAKLDRV